MTCLVVLTDSLYLPGTLRMLDSWRAHNDPLPVIALSRDRRALESESLANFCAQRHLIDESDYAAIRPYKKSRSKRHGETFFKFEAFQDFGFEQNLFLDSDVLCLRPTPFLTQPASHALRAALDTGFKKTRGYKGHRHEINTGVLAIGKPLQGKDTVDQLKRIAIEKPGRSGYNSGDQGIINKWIHLHGIDLGILPPDHNLIKKDYSDTTGIADCRILHFCGSKPWINNEPSCLSKLWFGETSKANASVYSLSSNRSTALTL